MLHPDKVETYERLHHEMPDYNSRRMAAQGFRIIRIYRHGLMLVMTVEQDELLVTQELLEPLNHSEDEELKLLRAATEACFAEPWRDLSLIYEFHALDWQKG
jgi:hypothetical protein